ncbi:MAG: 1-deoxy-D-xylulose-5-phosphate reductoisomerase [Desulfobacula sp.]|nr:1-deoxy-D-xylulose-5-phosphate reductoisomerase [Desulfobacula sp.]
MKNLSILGSTGSIGKNALEVVRRFPRIFNVVALSARTSIEALAGQIVEFTPETAAVFDADGAARLKSMLPANCTTEIVHGPEGYRQTASCKSADTVVTAMVGAAGLAPTIEAITSGKTICLANKETLVMAGKHVMTLAREQGVDILPIDSEHSAIFQCLEGNRREDLARILLTASGGPFRTRPRETFDEITVEDALRHPNWSMGPKITIDSATLMNKGLEIIEAVHLFDVTHDKIKVLVHPQSIVHSMVGYKDGSIMAQMGQPDMKGAISYALSEPDRIDLQMDFPDFTSLHSLTFENPDTQKFPSLLFAVEACKQKGTLPAVMNAANEVAVKAFLEKRINFLNIFNLISRTMELHTRIDNPDLSGIIEADCWARDKAQSLI